MKSYVPFHRLPDQGTLPEIMVYGLGTRIWHWLNAPSVLMLAVTGYLIGRPPPAVLGDVSSIYLMGWIRYLHLAFGYIFALLSLFRFILVFFEQRVTHQLFFPAVWKREWVEGFKRQLRWNLLIGKPMRYVGLNPLGGLLMLLMFVIPGGILILTGFGMYAEVAGHDSWQASWFGWLTLVFANTMDLHIIHRLAMWVIVWFMMAHIYIAIREDILSRQTTISTMLSGERQYRD